MPKAISSRAQHFRGFQAPRRQRVRHISSGFSPLQLSSLVAWYDFSNIGTLWQDAARTSAITTDGQEIKGVTDLSGNSHHLESVGAAGTFPIYKTNIQNSLSVCRIAADLLGTTDQITLSNDYTIFVVASRTANPGFESLWDGDIGAGPRNFQTRYEDSANTASILPVPGTGTLTSVAVSAAGTVDILSFKVTSNTAGGAIAYANGVPGTAQNSPVTTTTARRYQLGGSGEPATGPPGTIQQLTGDICEVLHCSIALAADPHNQVGNYLATKWGKTWTTVT